ncbi:HAD hydrolase-like protein [Armatimonas rosea]|uniref:Phosphonatase-like hydrolase n=1 Tax=Armatimonas rosea TaxID=685828 RepID=A0A7W9W6B5_ARMRO|nr:HAD hydrolase-like protein [Armatimonas rosea]MBB6051274.1 phosphonatase-like hydrolase [Armatimonas rosea]
MTRPELVIFDMAGTTVHDEGSPVHRCLREALAGAGVAVTHEQVNAVMGLPKPEAIRQLLVCGSEGRVAEIHQSFVERMIAHYQTHPAVREIEGTSLVFVTLREAGIKVALDTGFSRDIADVVISRLGWRLLIDGSVTSDEVPRGRPHPDMALSLMSRFGILSSARVAKVGDTPSDLQEGTGAGCGWVIGVWEGSHTREELAAHPHTQLLPNITHLRQLWGI